MARSLTTLIRFHSIRLHSRCIDHAKALIQRVSYHSISLKISSNLLRLCLCLVIQTRRQRAEEVGRISNSFPLCTCMMREARFMSACGRLKQKWSFFVEGSRIGKPTTLRASRKILLWSSSLMWQTAQFLSRDSESWSLRKLCSKETKKSWVQLPARNSLIIR